MVYQNVLLKILMATFTRIQSSSHANYSDFYWNFFNTRQI